jgi:hypothetical protein
LFEEIMIIPCGPNIKTIDGWTLITADSAFTAPPEWTAMGGTVVAARPDELPGLLDEGQAVVVHPDRYIAAVTDNANEAISRITDWLARSSTTTGASS